MFYRAELPKCHISFLVYMVGKVRGIANLRKRILHQMKTRLSLRRINSAALGNHRKPRGCCVTRSFSFGFTTCCLQNAREGSNRNKAIQACLLYSIFCKYLRNPAALSF